MRMKNTKRLVSLLLVGVMMLGATGFAFADAPFGPASIYAGLTGITEEEAYDLHLSSGSTFGELATEAGVYDAFKEAALAGKITMLNEMVADGDLSQEDADKIIAQLEDCDGTQSRILQGSNLGFGQKAQAGEHRGTGTGTGLGAGQMHRGGQR